MPKATETDTTPPAADGTHSAVIVPFPDNRPACPVAADAMDAMVTYVEKLPLEGVLSHALFALQFSQHLARPGSVAPSVEGATLAFLCLARALDRMGVPVAELVA